MNHIKLLIYHLQKLQSNDYIYCPPGPNNEYVQAIHKTHIANYFKDTTIVVLGSLRFFYFVYVLYTSSKS